MYGLAQFTLPPSPVDVSAYQSQVTPVSQLSTATLLSAMNQLPVSTTPDSSNPFSLQDLAQNLNIGGSGGSSLSANAVPISTLTLGIIGVALLLFGVVVGKR
jgi:hypothetical protein